MKATLTKEQIFEIEYNKKIKALLNHQMDRAQCQVLNAQNQIQHYNRVIDRQRWAIRDCKKRILKLRIDEANKIR